MKTSHSFFAALLTVAMASLPASAEQNVVSSADATPAGAAAEPANPTSPEPAAIDHVVYLSKLPTPAELMQGAKTQGIAITRIDQTSDRMVVVYQYSGGRTSTFAYTLLTTDANYPAPVASSAVSAPASTVTYTQTPQVVYAQPETIYYTPRYVRYYDPAWDFWTPLALGVGIGLIGGHGHGWYGGHGWSGGGHGWHGGHR